MLQLIPLLSSFSPHDEQSLAMQHFVGIYQDSLEVFSIEELRYAIYHCLGNVCRLHHSAFVTQPFLNFYELNWTFLKFLRGNHVSRC